MPEGKTAKPAGREWMNITKFAGKWLRSIPYLLFQASRVAVRKSALDLPPTPESLDEVGQILVIRLDAIGDFLMTTPALRSLRKRFPSARLDVLVQPGVEPVARGFPGVHDILTVPCQFLMRGGRRIDGIIGWLSILNELRHRKYDLVADFSGLFHTAAAAWVTSAPIRVGFRRPVPTGFFTLHDMNGWYTHQVEADETNHIADQMVSLAISLGGEPDTGGWEPDHEFDSSSKAEAVLKQRGLSVSDTPLALIHPGGKWPPKRWPARCFAALTDLLQEKKIRVALMGGPDEESLIHEIHAHCLTKPAILWPPFPLAITRKILKLANVFVGNDSGPMHLAAAAGTPVVALFGPTDPQRCAPRGTEFIPFYASLDCSPCPLYFSRNQCHRGHNYCMDMVAPEDVAAAVARLIEKSTPN